jgi:hypothetical protein
MCIICEYTDAVPVHQAGGHRAIPVSECAPLHAVGRAGRHAMLGDRNLCALETYSCDSPRERLDYPRSPLLPSRWCAECQRILGILLPVCNARLQVAADPHERRRPEVR